MEKFFRDERIECPDCIWGTCIPIASSTVGPRSGEYEKAIEAFKQSLKVNTGLTEAHYQIAQIQMVQKDQDSALNSIESAIKSAPTNLKYQKFRDKILG